MHIQDETLITSINFLEKSLKFAFLRIFYIPYQFILIFKVIMNIKRSGISNIGFSSGVCHINHKCRFIERANGLSNEHFIYMNKHTTVTLLRQCSSSNVFFEIFNNRSPKQSFFLSNINVN